MGVLRRWECRIGVVIGVVGLYRHKMITCAQRLNVQFVTAKMNVHQITFCIRDNKPSQEE